MSFTLGGKTAAELNIQLLEDTQIPMLPDTVDRTVAIGGRHGLHDFGADMGPRLIELDCVFTGTDDDEELQEEVRKLAAHLVDNWGRPKTLELIFDRETDKTWFVRYAGSLPIKRIIYHAKGFFTLPLIAYEPFAFGAEVEVAYDITLSPEDLWYVVTSGLNVPLTIILDNEGGNTIAGFSFKTFNELLLWEAP